MSAGYICEICSGRGSRWPVECHERWRYDEKTKIQLLKGLIALCPDCHMVKHFGRSTAIGKQEEAYQHLMAVNEWTRSYADIYIRDIFKIWERRSKERWTLDISWLKSELNPDSSAG